MQSKLNRLALGVMVLTGTLLSLSPLANAAKIKESTVKKVMKSPEVGKRVVLKGQIIADLGAQEYVFKDETGTIKVNIVNQVQGSNKIDPNAKAEINGLITYSEKKQPMIDVGLITLEVPVKE